MGCMRPNSRMEWMSSASASSSNTCRGWRGFGSISPGSISRYTAPMSAPPVGGRPPSTTSAAASPIRGPRPVSVGPVGSSEARPRPKPPFLRVGWDIGSPLPCCRPASLGELTARVEIAHRSPRSRVVVNDRHAVPGRLRDLDATGDDRAQHLVAEVTAYLVGNLVGELGASVVHRQDYGRDA